ncbi:MAG: flavodoxin family protein [Lentisphaeria bacterium]|nr:flavodoxin family protein [Lentisphaeria bacterium]
MKKILIISSSPRKDSNSDTLCDNFARGAAENGHSVEKITLAGKSIAPCIGCYACQKGKCIYDDAAPEIIQKMLDADVIVLATPVYFYTMCAQLKALIDRSVMVYPKITDKKFYYLITMADTAQEMFRGTIEALHGFVACCENSQCAGMVTASGVYEAGTINRTGFCEEAYNLGKSVK